MEVIKYRCQMYINIDALYALRMHVDAFSRSENNELSKNYKPSKMNLALHLLAFVCLTFSCFGATRSNENILNDFRELMLNKSLSDLNSKFVARTSVNTEGMRIYETSQSFATFTKTDPKFETREKAIKHIQSTLGEDFTDDFLYVELSLEVISDGKRYILVSAYVVLNKEEKISHCHPLDYFIEEL